MYDWIDWLDDFGRRNLSFRSRFFRTVFKAIRKGIWRRIFFREHWERIDKPSIEGKPRKRKVEKEDLDKLLKSLEGKAEGRVISPKEVVVDVRAREKCSFPICYGHSTVRCPPYSPTAEETGRLLTEYEYGILIRLRVDPKEMSWPGYPGVTWETLNEHRRTVGRTQALAMELGYHKSRGYSAGPCTGCGMFGPMWDPKRDKCAVLHGKPCKAGLFASSAMEACGIDVYRTIEKFGWKPNWIDLRTDPETVECAQWIGLVLVG